MQLRMFYKMNTAMLKRVLVLTISYIVISLLIYNGSYF